MILGDNKRKTKKEKEPNVRLNFNFANEVEKLAKSDKTVESEGKKTKKQKL